MCNSPSTLECFKAELQRCASGHLSSRITNKNEDYAVAFYAELFRNTEQTAKIFCEGAHSCIWHNPEFEEAFMDLLRKPGINIQVLTEEHIEDLTRFPEYLQNIIKNRVPQIQFRHLSEAAKQIITSRFDKDVNFAVFDADKFRFEFDKANYTAYGSFNDEEVVKEIEKYFDEAFQESEVTQFKFPAGSFETLHEQQYTWSGPENVSLYSAVDCQANN